MAFDRTDPIQLGQLKSEVENNPVLMPYDPQITAKVVGPINDPDLNTGPTESTRDIDDVAVTESSEIIDPGEYAALLEYDKIWVNTMIVVGDVPKKLRPYKSKFLQIFPNNSVTRDAAIALLTVDNSSRAQHLWGWGTTITDQDWFAAREYTG